MPPASRSLSGTRAFARPALVSLWWPMLWLLASASLLVAGARPLAPLGSASLGCRDGRGALVDWWAMYKFPGSYAFAYLDATAASACSSTRTEGGCWAMGGSFNVSTPAARTLAPLRWRTEIAYALYNDEDPRDSSEKWAYAHAKGALAFEAQAQGGAGFWLLHSAPKYPLPPYAPAWTDLAHAQSVFAQHFVCLSLPAAAAANLSLLLLPARPFIYAQQLPLAVALEQPDLVRLLAGAEAPRGQLAGDAQLSTAGGAVWQGLSKSSGLDVDLMDDVIVPALGASMAWQTWRNGGGPLPSRCRADHPGAQFDSINVQGVGFKGAAGSPWHYTLDHSKWGLSLAAPMEDGGAAAGAGGDGRRYVCLGDMNRASSQNHRGGSFACLQHSGLWNAFAQIVDAYEACRAGTTAAAAQE